MKCKSIAPIDKCTLLLVFLILTLLFKLLIDSIYIIYYHFLNGEELELK
jgi:hypothetical protein